VTEVTGAAPPPYVLDVSVLTAVARADAAVTAFALNVDAGGRTVVIPALAMTAASLDVRSPDADQALRGLERLQNAMVAPVHGARQAVRLAAVITRTGLDPWDAHVAAVADASICPILTLDGAKWRQHASDLDEPLHIVEIADPDEGESRANRRFTRHAVTPGHV
jgi:predicted nucleic acid-binding protein